MPRRALSFVLVVSLGVATAYAAELPDTGQELCFDGVGSLAVCSELNSGDALSSHPRQDARFGRDAKAAAGTLTKVGGGMGGFDYTKVSNGGTDLPAAALLGTGPTDWACTRDNVTGLTWEVKLADGGFRASAWTYYWYSSDGTTNGGYPGHLGSSGVCGNTLAQCNSEAFVAAVNGVGLCTFNDWRMPTNRELLTLINFGNTAPAIDTNYFPNTAAAGVCYLSATSDPGEYSSFPRGYFSAAVCFAGNSAQVIRWKYPAMVALEIVIGAVRLVRGTPF